MLHRERGLGQCDWDAPHSCMPCLPWHGAVAASFPGVSEHFPCRKVTLASVGLTLSKEITSGMGAGTR